MVSYVELLIRLRLSAYVLGYKTPYLGPYTPTFIDDIKFNALPNLSA